MAKTRKSRRKPRMNLRKKTASVKKRGGSGKRRKGRKRTSKRMRGGTTIDEIKSQYQATADNVKANATSAAENLLNNTWCDFPQSAIDELKQADPYNLLLRATEAVQKYEEQGVNEEDHPTLAAAVKTYKETSLYPLLLKHRKLAERARAVIFEAFDHHDLHLF